MINLKFNIDSVNDEDLIEDESPLMKTIRLPKDISNPNSIQREYIKKMLPKANYRPI